MTNMSCIRRQSRHYKRSQKLENIHDPSPIVKLVFKAKVVEKGKETDGLRINMDKNFCVRENSYFTHLCDNGQ